MTQVRPVGSKIMVRPFQGAALRMNGMLVPDTVAEQLTPCQGVVVGRGLRVTRVQVGARVLFGDGVGTAAWLDGEDFLFLDEKDVICELD